MLYLVTGLLFFLSAFIGYKWFQDKRKLSRYAGLASVENQVEKLSNKVVKMKTAFEIMSERYSKLSKEVAELDDESMLAEYGLYKYKYDFENSDEYKIEITSLKQKQKDMIKAKKAAYCNTEWTIRGSKKEGKRSTERLLKLTLNAYNVECDNLILKVKHSNVDAILERIGKVFERVSQLVQPQDCHISVDYHELKLKELALVYEYKEKVYQEKEEQRAIKEQMREEEKAKREYETELKRAEREEKQYQKALSDAQKSLKQAAEKERDKYLDKIKELEASLNNALTDKERVKSMAEKTKSGHVYIISNIGSFGEDKFKIGMTRRLEPLDRVKELGDASVPFSFDIHAMIYSENAPELEKEMHKHFTDKRLNKVNKRKEFFSVTIDELEQYCKEHNIKVELTKFAEAREYRDGLKVEKQSKPEKVDEVAKTSLDDLDLDFDAA